MDVRRSNIPCRVPKSVPERSSRTIKSPTSTDVKRASNNVSVHSSSDVRRTANSVLQTNTEIRRTPNSVAGLQTTTEVRRSPNAIASLQTSTEVRRTPNSVTTMHSSSEVRKSSNSVSSLTNSISRLSTSSSTSSTTSTSKPSSLLSKSQPVKRIERKPDESRPKADLIQVKPAAPADPNLVTCNICSRHFDPERIGLHMTICKKTSTKKRRPFDPVKHRLQGTEAEEYLRKPRRSAAASAKQDNSSTKKANWRKKHEEFISIVRAAREAQAYVAKGGKLSDLPPPPSLNTDDLTPCPHCGRKFAEGAAERHIPKCANIRSNKSGGASKARAAPGRR